MNLLASFKPIKLIAMDVDGVMTDGSLMLFPDFEYGRSMNIKDGYAIQLAVKKGYHIMVISGAKHDQAVEHRLKNLGVTELHMEIKDKAAILEERKTALGLKQEEILFMGDDIPDMRAMKIAGLACCPADACSDIINIAHYISPLGGGKGCVRDVLEKILKLNDHWLDDEQIRSK